MAKITKKVLGNPNNKVGDIVFSKFRNMTTARAYQPIVANPRTSAQRVQRTHLLAMSKLAKVFSSALYIGFKEAVNGTKWSPRNRFSKVNWGCIAALADGEYTITQTDLQVSEGTFIEPITTQLSFDDPNEVAITLRPTAYTSQGVQATDVSVKLVYWCPDINKIHIETAGGEAASHTWTVFQEWEGQKIYVYAFSIYNGDNVPEYGYTKGMRSATTYVGSGNIS